MNIKTSGDNAVQIFHNQHAASLYSSSIMSRFNQQLFHSANNQHYDSLQNGKLVNYLNLINLQ